MLIFYWDTRCNGVTQFVLNFLQDSNSVPTVYLLQPITTHLPNYNNTKEPELSRKDRKEWWDTFSHLQRIFRTTAKEAIERQLLGIEEIDKYYISGRRCSYQRAKFKIKMQSFGFRSGRKDIRIY